MSARTLPRTTPRESERPGPDRPGLRRAIVRTRPISEAPYLRVPQREGFFIATSRLVLAPAVSADAHNFFHAVCASRSSLEPWLPWVPFIGDPAAAARYLEASERDWDESRACRFSVRDRETQQFLGIVSFEHLVHAHQSADFGYWLRDNVVGKGLLQEAGERLLAWAFDALGAERIRVAASTKNERSLRTIQRLGFRYEGTSRRAEHVAGRWLDHAVFAMVRDDRILEPVTLAAGA